MPVLGATKAQITAAERKPAAPAKPPALPRAARSETVLKTALPKTFEGAPKLQQTNARTPMPKATPEHHSLFSLHTLGEGAQDVAHAVSGAVNATYGTKDTRASTPRLPGATIQAPGSGIAGAINTSRLAGSLGRAAESIPGSAVRSMTQIPEAVVGTGKAAVDLAKGNPKPAEQMGSALAQIALHPLKYAEHEPVNAALMFAGGEAGIGDTARSAMEHSGSDALKAAASTARPPLKVYGDLEIPREYSKDVLRKGMQVAADKFRERVFHEDPNQASGARLNRLVYGGGVLGQYMEHAGVPILGHQGFFKPGLVDKTEAASKMIRKLYSNSADGFMRHIDPGDTKEAVPLITEGTIRHPDTVAEDLAARKATLDEQAKNLTGNEARLNGLQRQQVEGLQRNREFIQHPQTAFQAAKDFGDRQQPLTDRKVQLGILEPDQEHAKLVPYATQHMGAEYNTDPGQHPLLGAIRDLKARERAARTTTQLADTRGALLKAEHDLANMKAAGHIKANGHMYPRLELDGKPLTADEIMAHARENGVEDRELGFITHKETSWAKAGRTSSTARPAIERRSRTGVSYKTGTYNSSWEGLLRQARKDSNEIAEHEGKDEVYRRFGLGSYQDADAATRAADNFNHTPDGQLIAGSLGEMVPVRVGPERVLARGNMPAGDVGKAISDFGLQEHKAVDQLGPEGKWRLIPRAVDERLKEHEDIGRPSKAVKGLQNYTNKWRSTALFTLPRWPIGVGQENAIRLAFSGINPFAMFGMGRTAKLGGDIDQHFRAIAADPAATEAQRFAARTQVASMDAGQQYGSYVYNSVRRMTEDTMPPEARTAMNAFTEGVPVSQMLRGWNVWKDFLGHGLREMETNTKKAMLGKVALKEAGTFTNEWRALVTRQDRAVKAFADGKLTPSTSMKLGDDLLKQAGNWTTLTPAVRKAAQTYSPFGLWWLNSMKFVFQTLPADHPFKTAALAAMEAGTGAGSKETSTPAYLAGGIVVNLPVVGAIRITPLHYSPFGIGVAPVPTAFGMLYPQFTDAGLTTVGIKPASYESEAEPFGPKIPEGVSLLKGAETIPEGIMPGLRAAEQIVRGGGKQVPGSLNPFQVKPGTKTGVLGAALKYVAPFPFTKEAAAAGGGDSSSGTGLNPW
jgi:hypothetical protein